MRDAYASAIHQTYTDRFFLRGFARNQHIFEFIRTIAVARILLPASYVRLSAGREQMSDEAQALCFLAGANSMFMGEKLLTAGNQSVDHDKELFRRLDITAES